MNLRIVLIVVFSLTFGVEGLAQNAPLIEIDSNYALDMAKRNKAWKDRAESVDPCKIVEALHKPVLICETGYPATDDFGGQFAQWNLPAEGYPLRDDGQAKWIADLAAVIRQDPNFAGVFYWSPEWYDGGLWDAFALFDSHGVARPGVRSFKHKSPFEFTGQAASNFTSAAASTAAE